MFVPFYSQFNQLVYVKLEDFNGKVHWFVGNIDDQVSDVP